MEMSSGIAVSKSVSGCSSSTSGCGQDGTLSGDAGCVCDQDAEPPLFSPNVQVSPLLHATFEEKKSNGIKTLDSTPVRAVSVTMHTPQSKDEEIVNLISVTSKEGLVDSSCGHISAENMDTLVSSKITDVNCARGYDDLDNEKTDALLSKSTAVVHIHKPALKQLDNVPDFSHINKCDIRVSSPSECHKEAYESNECGVQTFSYERTKPSSCGYSSVSSRDSSNSNLSGLSEEDETEPKTVVDSSTQTAPSDTYGNKTTKTGVDGGYRCNNQQNDRETDYENEHRLNSNVNNKLELQESKETDRLDVGKTVTSKISVSQRRQKPCNSDYSSLSSCESARVSDTSNRSDSGNSPGSSCSNSSSNSTSSKNTHSNNKYRETNLKKVSASSELSPIASCGGGESNVSFGLTVSIGFSSSSSIKDLEGSRSPCTPTSGCLKAGTRSASGAHVQFDTPYHDEEDQVLHQTLVSQDGQVTVHKPTSGNVTPTHGDQFSRIWSKLMPDSSSADVASNLLVPKKWRRRHMSGSSSISVGSSSSDSSNSHETELERRAPDGGWGWVVVAASFMVHCIADGVTMSFGVLFVELLNYFQEGKSLTSWIGSLFMAIPLLAGPIASVLTDRYGCQTVTICGAIVASFGFFISAFVNTIPLLLLTVGVITGLGLAVCYVAAIVIVAFYFEKKRSLATGIAVAGSGIGTILFAPLIQYLVDYWGWRLGFIILSGIFLNMVVCGALMHDLEWTPRSAISPREANTPAANSHRGSTSQSLETVGGRRGGSIGTALPSLQELRRLVQSGDVAALMSPDDAPSNALRGSASLVLLPTFLSRSQFLPPDVIPCLSSRANAYEVVSQMYPHLLSHSLSGHVNQVDQLHPQLDKKQPHACSHKEKICDYASTTMTSIGSFGGYSQDKTLSSPLPHASNPGTGNTTPASLSGDTVTMHNGHHKKVDAELSYPVEDDDGDDADNEEENEDPQEVTAMLGWSKSSKGPHQPGLRRISTGCMGGTTSPPPPVAPLRNMKINRSTAS